jgi:hypothetical protein
MPAELTLSTGSISAMALVFLWSMVQTFGLEYFPWIKEKYDAYPPGQKKTGGLYVLSIAGVVDAFTPDLAGFVAMLGAYLASLGIQYGVHGATKRT